MLFQTKKIDFLLSLLRMPSVDRPGLLHAIIGKKSDLDLDLLSIKERDNIEDQAREWMRAVGLEDQMSKLPHDLSGGQKQRVAIARAFASRPTILFADEPTGNLDTANGEKIIDLLFDLNSEFGTTIVLVTHESRLADRCSRTIKLTAGKVDR